MEDEKKMFSTEEANNDIKDSEAVDTLDALLFDSEDDLDTRSDGDIEDFDAFMAEYRSLISKSLFEASGEVRAELPAEERDEESERKEYEAEYLAPLPKKRSQKKKQKKAKPVIEAESKKTDWDEDITLEPEEYEELVDESNIMLDEIAKEPTPDFDLGQSAEDNKFQLSISFDDSGRSDESPTAADEELYEYDPEKPRAIDWVFDVAEMFVFVLALVMILTTFVFKHSVVEGPSMNNTLEDGDHLIISDMFYTPERGDIIVFEDYSTILKKAVVKRIVGLPGETVEVKVDESGIVRVYIDGELLPEEYAYNAKDCDITDYHAPVTLGENEVFVMGDNRYHSTDSRHSGVGPIEIDSILGKVLFRFFPFDKFGAVD